MNIIGSLAGIEMRASCFMPTHRLVPIPPKNRRDARRRVVIARRRKKRGLPIPTHERREGVLFMMQANGAVGPSIFASPENMQRFATLCTMTEPTP